MGELAALLASLMPGILRDLIRRRTAIGALQVWARPFARVSYSQDGEDLLLLNLLPRSDTPGFYVDVGACHPARYSNTLLFYLKGWRGINIDAMPGSMTIFRKRRPRDVNLEIGISETEGSSTYYMFNDPALNCFSEELATSRDTGVYCLINKVTVNTKPLRAVLSEYVPRGTAIDFMTVDVEGMDLEVLKTNDWNRWRPTIVLAEETQLMNVCDIGGTEIVRCMREVGYILCGRARLSLCFAEESYMDCQEGTLRERCVQTPSARPAEHL